MFVFTLEIYIFLRIYHLIFEKDTSKSLKKEVVSSFGKEIKNKKTLSLKTEANCGKKKEKFYMDLAVFIH